MSTFTVDPLRGSVVARDEANRLRRFFQVAREPDMSGLFAVIEQKYEASALGVMEVIRVTGIDHRSKRQLPVTD